VLGLGVALALIDGATAHAIPGLPGASLGLVALHVVAMAIWVGGLAAFLVAPDRRFARYAAAAFAVAIGSGILLALAHTGFPPALATTAYGWALVIKVAAVGSAGVLAVFGRRRIEYGVVAAILAVAAALVSLPPPR
jgi:putative copper export protein